MFGLGSIVAAGFGLGLMGNPPRRRRKAKHRRNPMQQTIVFSNSQVRILHTRTPAGSAYYIVDRDVSGEYNTVTAIATSRTSDLLPGPNRIPKDSPPWKRAEKAWEEFKSGRSNPKHRRRRNPSAGAHELTLYITNDGDLYRQNIKYVIANLAKKIKKGKYDAKLALKLWKHSADWGAQKYTKEHGGSGNGSYGSFNATDRREAAAELQEYYQEELNDAAGLKTNPERGFYRRSKNSSVFRPGDHVRESDGRTGVVVSRSDGRKHLGRIKLGRLLMPVKLPSGNYALFRLGTSSYIYRT